jgi:hypothetical protein
VGKTKFRLPIVSDHLHYAGQKGGLILGFFTFSTIVPLIFVTYLPKVPKIATTTKILDPVTASSLV